MSSSGRASSRKSKGRRKVTMAKMENQSSLQVTFSKRRVGLLKKASELCVLCGVEVAIIIFSPANKVYSFGHPDAEQIISKFLNGTSPRRNNNIAADHELIVGSHRSSAIRGLNLELVQVESMLTAEKKRREELDKITKTGHMWRRFPPSLDGLDYARLSASKEAILELKKNFEGMAHKGIYTVSSSQHPLDCYDSLMQKNENLNGYDPVMVGSSIHGGTSFAVNSWSSGLGHVSPYLNPLIGISDSMQIAGGTGTSSRTRGPNAHDNFRDILDPMAISSGPSSSAANSILPYGTASVIESRGSGLGELNNGYGSWPTN
ncbi:agamous-like MADS-box protein AGL14 [Henckelia pumila]|uniref:agamous-like MADS-box protein AGL14 n=1 Tax=Henckelia pumila TaxID=405737 RepID=UPI003C6DF342